MGKTFDTVDEKVAEAEFFLKKMKKANGNIFEFRCNLSAFLSAARTITLALQQFNTIPGFVEWYRPHQKNLQVSQLAKYFLEIRNDLIHGGYNHVSSGSYSRGKVIYYFSGSYQDNQPPEKDVFQASLDYFILLLAIVYDCYVQLGVYIDPQQHYTEENYTTMGLTIDNAEVEVYGFSCGFLSEKYYNEGVRWRELRKHVGICGINNLFYTYLGCITPQP